MKRSSPIIDDSIAIAVLAAGSGSRFGGGKLDADLCGRPVGQWVTDAAENAGFTRRFVIASQVAPTFVSQLSGWETVINVTPSDGIAGSIRAAICAARSSHRIVFALADMPLISCQHLSALALGNGVVFTAYPGGGRGVPAAFPKFCYGGLGELGGTLGAASADWGEEITSVAPNSDASLLDVDTGSDINIIRKLVNST